ncbi:unnamed protein product [Mytilus edulis]|uniref:SWIM-type domain-containing protein n=1 Tax=Mytilus edulis TaxID=6550 RepID=A0A8S3SEU3_MYTED|nr:unnamed protein product [Mytilus edulis]
MICWLEVLSLTMNTKLTQKCSCPDWRKHHWSCKHMLAVMMNMPNKDWNTLPEYLKATPHFNIDFGLLETNRTETLIVNNASSSMKYECQQDSTACRDNTVENSSSKAQNLCLDNIKQITSNLFCVNNSQYLEEFNNRLVVLVKETEMEASPHQNGLRLDLPATKKKTICRSQKNSLHLKKNYTLIIFLDKIMINLSKTARIVCIKKIC